METEKRYIRLLEFGPPKTGKTSNTASTFPGPILILNFDPDGYSSVRGRPVVKWESEKFREVLARGEFQANPETVHVLDYTGYPEEIGALVTRPMVAKPIVDCIKDINALGKTMPFSTVMVDPVTMWDGAINDFVGAMNSVVQLQIQHWGQAAKKKEEIINFVNALPCHTVFLAHEDTERDELTGQIRVMPLVTGQMKNKIGMMFSQVLYSTTETKDNVTKYVVWTKPQGIVKGLGCRWPQDLPAVVENNFEKIFGGKI